MSRFFASKRAMISPTSLRSTASGLRRTKVRSDMAAHATGEAATDGWGQAPNVESDRSHRWSLGTFGAWPLPSVGEVPQHWSRCSRDIDAAGGEDRVVGVGAAHRRLACRVDVVVDVDLLRSEL